MSRTFLGGHKIAYLRKVSTLSKTTLGDSLQLYLTDYCNEGAHLDAHIVILKFCNSTFAVIIESQYLSHPIYYCFFDFVVNLWY